MEVKSLEELIMMGNQKTTDIEKLEVLKKILFRKC